MRAAEYKLPGWILLSVALGFLFVGVFTPYLPVDRWTVAVASLFPTAFALIALGARQDIKLREAETARYKAETERKGTSSLYERALYGYGPDKSQ